MGSKAARILPVLLVFCMVTAFMLTGIPTARAADDDFEVQYEFYPSLTGYKGGDIRLDLTIQNTGATNITAIHIVVNTQAGYTQNWSGSISPGTNQTLAYYVPFSEADVNTAKLLQVSMNNDSDANVDGVRMFSFEIEGTRDIFSVSTRMTPEQTIYHPGDTVNVRLTFTNNFETHAATGVNIQAFLGNGHVTFATMPAEDKGNVMPGASVSYSFDYTFSEDDIGPVYLHYVNKFTIVGASYTLTDWTKHFEVAVAGYIPGATFSADEPTPTVSSTSAPTDAPTTETPTLEPSPALTEPQTLLPTPTPSSSPLAEAADAQPSQDIPTIVLLAIIAVLLLAIGVLLTMFLLRSKKTKQQ